MRVLIVDDDPTVLRIHSMMLEHLGCTVVGTADFDEALAKCSDVDLVLTDVRLGAGRDGVALAEAIRAVDGDVPIVGVTGAQPDRNDVFDHIELKPVRLAAFEGLVARFSS
ncbi:MAG: response regulator [Proteobacteria bacterium]|nr:response regulator [Pseudomonadota bacterium]